MTEPPVQRSEFDKCPQCGIEFVSGKQFCPNCGVILYPRNPRIKPAPWWALALLGIIAFAFAITGGCGLVFTIMLLGEPGIIALPIIIAAVCLSIAWLLVRLIIRLKRGE